MNENQNLAQQTKKFEHTMKRESKARKCKAKNPEYCRYHGVPAPESITTMRNAFYKTDEAFQDAYREGHFEEADSLKEKKTQLAQKIAGAFLDKEEGKKFLESHLGKPLFKRFGVSEFRKERLNEINNYKTELAKTLFTDADEYKIARYGTPTDVAYDVAKKNKYPTAEYFPSYDGDAYVGPADTTIPARKAKVEEWAKQNSLDVVVTRYNVMGKAFVPFSWENYGLSEEKYNEISARPDFKQKLASYKSAVSKAHVGDQVSALAGQREPKLFADM